MSEVTKIKCSGPCQQEKDATTDNFHKRGNKLQTICRVCRNAGARNTYKVRGKAPLPRFPFQTISENFPALADRITELEPRLRAKASAFAHDALDADDIYSEMVEAILRKCKPEDTDGFLMQCANWTAQAYVAKRVSYGEYVQDLDIDEDEAEAAGFKVVATRTIEDTLVQRETLKMFEKVIKSLPAENQKVVALLSVGMNQREIAKELKVSEQTISERMKKIRDMLTNSLKVKEFSFAM